TAPRAARVLRQCGGIDSTGWTAHSVTTVAARRIPCSGGAVGAVSARATSWRGEAPPDEATLQRAFAAEGLSPYAWSNDAGYTYASHTHTYHKGLYVLRA